MTEKELIAKVEDTMIKLYQNRELEGLQQVKDLLPVFQDMIQQILAVQMNQETMGYFTMLKELVAGFQDQNMLGMADCLKQNAFGLIECYYQ